MLNKGLVQIYTGDGKGKTTAAFGLALRAAGQGNKVLIYQFLKPPSLDIGERFSIKLGAVRIRVEALDIKWDMKTSLEDEQKRAEVETAITDVLARIAETAEKRFYDVIVLDEIVFCYSKGLAKLEDIKNIIEKKDSLVEIVLTGCGVDEKLMELADLVTEMKKIKHPFDKGINARCGIEY
ncbi:MAG: cob(I)yrinic acid a,c-diamide adenosyltransferase [Planctomycetota bacterium]|jgi:cob(I)alamin adenosyltransferase